jgi:hypothetical protein
MAQFYADIQGNRGPASRMGSKDSGIESHTRGWHVGCKVRCVYDKETDSDIVYVYRTSGSNGHESDVLIATLYEDGRVAFEKEIDAQYGIKFEKDPNTKTLKKEKCDGCGHEFEKGTLKRDDVDASLLYCANCP